MALSRWRNSRMRDPAACLEGRDSQDVVRLERAAVASKNAVQPDAPLLAAHENEAVADVV